MVYIVTLNDFLDNSSICKYIGYRTSGKQINNFRIKNGFALNQDMI